MEQDGRLLDDRAVMQICFVTDDVNKTTAWFADLFGVAPGELRTSADAETAKARYKGEPAVVSCKTKIFSFDNIDIEILEPGPEKSAWRDVLEEKGPCVHHIAIRTRNMTKRSAYLEGNGQAKLQSGEFNGGGGGRYAYFDASAKLGTLIELLEFDNDKEPQP